MSVGGRINLARERALRRQRLESNSRTLVERAVQDIQCEACNDLTTFFIDSLASTLTAPLNESLNAYVSEISKKGAMQIGTIDEFADEYQRLRVSNIQIAQEQNIQLPSILVETPAFFTKEALDIQQSVSGLLRNNPDSAKIDTLAKAMTDNITSTQETYDMACVVAGCHLDDPNHSVFSSIQNMIKSIDKDAKDQIKFWVEQTSRELEQQAEKAWIATTLGIAKIAIEKTGYTVSEVNLAERSISGTDPDDPNKKISVSVEPEKAEITYDLSGFQGRTCRPVEKALLDNIEQIIGVKIPTSSKVSRPKRESYEKPSTSTIKSNISNKNTYIEQEKARE